MRERAEDKLYTRLGRLRMLEQERGDRPVVVVAGCVAQQEGASLQKRAGGHVFQLNFSNSTGTTPGQVARGGGSNDDWYMGFNIARKFWR